MTVCVATLANNHVIFGAADRMLTRGATQTEPESSKIYHLVRPRTVTVMWAGSSAVFAEVMQSYDTIAMRAPADKYSTIQDLVMLYCDCFSGFIGKRAERAILTRLGLTAKDLLSNKVSQDRALALVQQVTDYCLMVDESVEVIFMGQDEMGGHIWTAHNEVPYNHDVEGYAAIGIGAEHADSQLRFAGYTGKAEPAEALIMAYLAKRRAEIAPGVGRITDMCGRTRDNGISLSTEWLDALGKEYDRFAQSEKDSLRSAVASSVAAMRAMAPEAFKPPPTDPVAGPQSPPASTHGP